MSLPQHIKVKKEDVAERVIMSGDPARVVQLSKALDDARLINENRGFVMYTGRYKGTPVTLACHGIGAASAALVFEELVMLGAKSLVRLGSSGALKKGMAIGEVVVPTGAAYLGGTLEQYVPDAHLTPVPDFQLTHQIVSSAAEAGLTHYVGPVFSSDAFYAEDPNFVGRWAGRGYIAVEMECATIFGLALMRGVKAGSLLLISDNLAEMTPMVDAEYLKPFVEKSSRAVFEALTKVPA
ncbi:MAG: purine-nucleoside phosphorylase [Nitrososphaerota archaeon]|nr:purine-nucleoside phosphorylase [Nitrososphaerota archaeon]MDG6939134.1 purine-nucleoside phosphorylase [Nitrososphaerota archaeon]